MLRLSRQVNYRGTSAILALVTTALLIAGCASTSPTPKVGYEDPAFAAMSRCEQAAEMLGWDALNYSQKQAILETARNEGCFGKPLAQEVVVR